MDRGGPSAPEIWDALFGEFYLRAYADEDRGAEAETQALAAVALAGCPEGGAVLDAPCGFGRHAIPLARAGFRVTGVDRSELLLAEARRRRGDDAGPELVCADYRELPLPDASFDAALNLFTSLGYLGDEEDTRALAEIGRVLRPGGRLIIETMHRDFLARVDHANDWRLLGGGRLMLEQHAFDPAAGVAQSTQTLIDGDGRRESRSFTVRVYTATELTAMLARAGFAAARCYGDLAGAALSPTTRLVIAARR